jgi:hypothetical protein
MTPTEAGEAKFEQAKKIIDDLMYCLQDHGNYNTNDVLAMNAAQKFIEQQPPTTEPAEQPEPTTGEPQITHFVPHVPSVEQEASTGYYIEGKEVTQDELYRHVGAKVFYGLRKGNLPGCSQEVMRLRELLGEPQITHFVPHVPGVDLAAHERREYQCAIDDMRKECQELRKRVDELAVKKSFVVGCLHIAEAERDKLREELAELQQDNAKQTAEKYQLAKRCDELAAQLAASKAPEPQEEWKELSKGDQYSGPGQVRDFGDLDWQDATISACDNDGNLPFIARVPGKFYTAWRYCRIRIDAKGGA